MQTRYEWVERETNQAPTTEDEQQLLYLKYAKQVADEEMPWLFPLLHASGVKTVAAVGLFGFQLNTDSGDWHVIPELGDRLRMVPWVTEDDIRQ